ncbi:MAG: hypothetical protein A2Z83_09475 [Omnitrophica bacterium GWA2_52_8]|nr:MAG: hypothetical protein A2Z83_09475 [Omnitrophica bacterium GWA2_52_8]
MIHQTKDDILNKMAQKGIMDEKSLKDLVVTARKDKKSIFHMIVEKNIKNDQIVTEFLSTEMNLPIVNIPALRIPQQLTKAIPKKLVEEHQCFPISRIGNVMAIAVADPFNLILRDNIKEITGCQVCYTLSPLRKIQAAIDRYYGESANLDKVIDNMEQPGGIAAEGGNDKKVSDLVAEAVRGGEDAPVIKMVKIFLEQAIRMRASDIHFEPYENNFRVRYRIDGVAKEAYAHSRELYNSLVTRIKIMSDLDITEKRLPQDGRFRTKLGNREIDFRVSILPIYHGEKVVLRILDRSGVKSGLNNLGFTDKPTQIFAKCIQQPYGMILVTGPTGSGKSTTLYTILNSMNTPERNIMTIEDPVEYQLEGITQTQVHSEIGLTFASGLRTLLRQSPDIILVGEIRDQETADIAVKAALTGHLVFSTLHTNNAAGAMTRLVDMGIEPFLIASSVICVAAQRLVRKVCPHCKSPVKIAEEVLERCHLSNKHLEGVVAYHGKGCPQCNHTGYFGRLGTIEILQASQKIRDMVLARRSSDDIMTQGVKEGMESLFENAFGLFKQGLTTMEEVLRVTTHE